MKRVVLALAALVVVLAAVFVVWSDGSDEVPRVARTHDAATYEATEGRELDANLAIAPSAPVDERRAIDARFAPIGQTVATSGGARRWSELLLPIDAESSEPIALAMIVFFDANGARRERPLDGAIDMRDLRAGVLAVIDAPTHVARPFLPIDFAANAPGPLTVELRPSAALHIVAHATLDLSQRPIEYSIESGYDGRASGSDADRAAIDVSRRLRELLHGDLDVSARAQRVAALTVRREPAALPLFDLARTPDPSFGAQTRLTLPDRLPWVIDDLPAGVSIAIELRLTEPLRIASDSDFATLDALKSIVLERSASPRLVIERATFGTVRGRLDDFAGGPHEIWIESDSASPSVMHRTFVSASTGEFELELVASGRQLFCAYWVTTSGASAEYALRVDVPVEGVLDLGVLRVDAQSERHTLTVRTNVTIDGVAADPAADHRLRGGTWTVELQHTSRGVRERTPSRSVTAAIGDAATFDDVLPGRYRLALTSAHVPQIDRVVLSPALTADQMRSDAHEDQSIAVFGDIEHVVDIALRSHWRTTIRFVHDRAAPLPSLGLSLTRRGQAADEDSEPGIHDIPLADGAPQEHALRAGAWVARVQWMSPGLAEAPSDRTQRLVGFRAFDIGEADEEVVEITLVAACALELARAVVEKELDTSKPGTLQRMRVVSAAGNRGPQPIASDATTITFEDLLPETEYIVHPLGRKFRTGATGSVTRIDA